MAKSQPSVSHSGATMFFSKRQRKEQHQEDTKRKENAANQIGQAPGTSWLASQASWPGLRWSIQSRKLSCSMVIQWNMHEPTEQEERNKGFPPRVPYGMLRTNHSFQAMLPKSWFLSGFIISQSLSFIKVFCSSNCSNVISDGLLQGKKKSYSKIGPER